MKNFQQRFFCVCITSLLSVAAFISLAVTTSPETTAVATSAAAPALSISTIGPIARTTVAARGEVKITVDPDIAIVNLGVSTTNKDAAAARQQNTKAMTAVTDALKKAGVAAKDIQTSNMSIYPTYDYQKSSTEITGYQVSNQVTITVRDLTKLGDVVNAAMKAGANQLNGISFDLNDKDSVYNTALGDATKKAASKAKVMAAAAGLKLGEIESIVEGGADYSPYYGMGGYVDMPMADAAKADNIGNTIQIGQIDVTASVTVTYAATK